MWLQNFDNNFSIWREMDQMRREMDRLLARSPRFVNAPTFPALNVWSNAEEVLVTAEIPGIDPKAIDISVVGETLTINGFVHFEAPQGYELAHAEYGIGNYQRSFTLPNEVDRERISATVKQGVLQLVMPKVPEARNRKIAVKAR